MGLPSRLWAHGLTSLDTSTPATPLWYRGRHQRGDFRTVSQDPAKHDQSRAAIGRWVERYSVPLYQFAIRLTHQPETAEEIVQEVSSGRGRCTNEGRPRPRYSAEPHRLGGQAATASGWVSVAEGARRFQKRSDRIAIHTGLSAGATPISPGQTRRRPARRCCAVRAKSST